jgi:hypothetical protein
MPRRRYGFGPPRRGGLDGAPGGVDIWQGTNRVLDGVGGERETGDCALEWMYVE